MSKSTFEVTRENFQDQVLRSALPVLVEFTAEWCPPCKMLAPLIDNIALKYQGQIAVGTLDSDAYPEFTERFNVYGIPTLILFVDGKPVHHLVGFKPQAHIERELMEHVQLQLA